MTEQIDPWFIALVLCSMIFSVNCFQYFLLIYCDSDLYQLHRLLVISRSQRKIVRRCLINSVASSGRTCLHGCTARDCLDEWTGLD